MSIRALSHQYIAGVTHLETLAATGCATVVVGWQQDICQTLLSILYAENMLLFVIIGGGQD